MLDDEEGAAGLLNDGLHFATWISVVTAQAPHRLATVKFEVSSYAPEGVHCVEQRLDTFALQTADSGIDSGVR